MLGDVDEGRIDQIVVYKIDRLTRSLADFAKMVEIFDRHGVSFVSVTQQFNTTMVDLLLAILHWLLLIFFGGQAIIFVGLVLWTIWTDAIKPRLIPADDIVRVADDIIARYPDQLEALARHERAWCDSDGAEQAYWYRVRKAVRRRLERA